VEIRAIRVICVPRRDGEAISYVVTGIAKLCGFVILDIITGLKDKTYPVDPVNPV
jgi:hypothetical protein